MPSKCIPSVTTISSLIVHAGICAWQAHGLYENHNIYIIPEFSSYGGRLKFLTMLTAYALCIGSGFAFLIDLIQILTKALEREVPTKEGYSAKQSFLISVRDEIMSFWLYCPGAFVPIMYWGIVKVDLESIHPPEVDKIYHINSWHNHYLHTVPFLLVHIAILTVNYQYITFRRTFVNVTLFAVVYLGWLAKCKQINGKWAYDIMDKFDNSQLGLFILMCIVNFVTIAMVGRFISSVKWNDERKERILIAHEKKK